MKRLVSKKEKERRDKRNKLILGSILVFVMLLSVIGFSFGPGIFDRDDKEIVEYEGFKFYRSNDYWVINNFMFRYNPHEVPNIGQVFRDATFYLEFPLYIYSENEEAKKEIERNLGFLVDGIEEACLEEFDCPEDVQIRTCSDNFIIIKESSINEIYEENNCVFIEGKQEDLVRLTNQFLFKILTIR